MKNIFKITAISFIMIFTLLTSNQTIADPPGMPDNHGTNGDVPGGGAPIDGGVVFLILLGATYAGKKVYLKN